MTLLTTPSAGRAAPAVDLLRDIAAEIDRCAARIADGRDPPASTAAVQALGRLDAALAAVASVLGADAVRRRRGRPPGDGPDSGTTAAADDDARVEAMVEDLARLQLHIAEVRAGHGRLVRATAVQR